MRASLKRIVVLIVGWSFIGLGVVGLFLPVLQGILFLLIGLFMLSTEYVWAHHLLNRLKLRFPSIAHRSHEASRRASAWLRRIWRREAVPPCGK